MLVTRGQLVSEALRHRLGVSVQVALFGQDPRILDTTLPKMPHKESSVVSRLYGTYALLRLAFLGIQDVPRCQNSLGCVSKYIIYVSSNAA